ncbi:MAG: sugar ABC transporter substrate-binding protein [Gemmatimonadetes bacterium]|nr:sugar ABC transporter substrate-binding protein [Gemmatimonadota bacterium]
MLSRFRCRKKDDLDPSIRRFAALALLQAAFLPAQPRACADSISPWQVGVLYGSMEIPGHMAMRRGLESEAERIREAAKAAGVKGIRIETRVAGGGPEGIERQIGQMNELISARVDLLIVQPSDNAALSRPLRRANGEGMPVVTYDQYIYGGAIESYVTSDGYGAGFFNGEYIASRFPDDHTIRLALVEYPHLASMVERVNGFLDALNRLEQSLTIVGTYEAIEPRSGAMAGAEILADFPDSASVDVVFSVSNAGGLALVDALAEAGRREILVATIDGDPESVENIRADRLTVIDCALFRRHMGAAAMRAGWAILNGEEIRPLIRVPVFPITRETLSCYGGWSGEHPEPFALPWPSKTPQWRWESVDRVAGGGALR